MYIYPVSSSNQISRTDFEKSATNFVNKMPTEI